MNSNIDVRSNDSNSKSHSHMNINIMFAGSKSGSYLNVDSSEQSDTESTILKIGLFGPGDSGKTTFLKHLEKHVIPVEPSRPTNSIDMKYQVYTALRNIMNDIELQVVEGKIPAIEGTDDNAEKRPRTRFLSRKNSTTIHEIKIRSELLKIMPHELRSKINNLLSNQEVMKLILKNHRTLGIHESVSYWFPERVKDILKDGYEATMADHLHCRIQNASSNSRDLKNDRFSLRIIDSPGERSIRSGIVNLYEGTDFIVFFTSLTSYTQRIHKDFSATLMHDSFALFEAVVNHSVNETKPVLLILTKQDVFETILKKFSFTDAFPELNGSPTISNIILFIISQFKDRIDMTNRNSKFQIHILDCTDPRKFSMIIENVFRQWEKELAKRIHKVKISVPQNNIPKSSSRSFQDIPIAPFHDTLAGDRKNENFAGTSSFLSKADDLLLSITPNSNKKQMKRGSSFQEIMALKK